MRPDSDTIRFALVFTLLTTVLGWVFWSSGTSTGSYTVNTSMLAIPVVSAMLGSVGFTWGRKMTFSALTMGLYLVSIAAADSTGLSELVSRQLVMTETFPSVLAIVYVAFVTAFPFAMLVLFVGKSPSLMWRRQSSGR